MYNNHDVMIRSIQGLSEKEKRRRLSSLFSPEETLWTLGEDGSAIQIVTDIGGWKISLLNLSDKDDTTVKYLWNHDVGEIFAGKNPDMMPNYIDIIDAGDGNGVVRINFKCSEKLKSEGIDDSFNLNYELDNPSFSVIVEGRDSDKYTIGYHKDEEKLIPYVEIQFSDGTMQTVFDLTSTD